MNVQTLTPAEIDTLLSDIYRRAARPQTRAQQSAKAATDARYPRYGRPDAERAARLDEQADRYAAEAREILAECAPYDAEYDARGGWTRAFIVADGHVHSSMSCHTCYVTTQFGWLPQVSGQTEAEIVEQAGEGACTICYPTAPVVAKGTRTLFTEDEIAKAARRVVREAAAAAKAAKKAENALGARIDYVETITAAKSYLTDVKAYGYGANGDAIAAALASRTGVTVEQVWADAAKRAAKRR